MIPFVASLSNHVFRGVLGLTLPAKSMVRQAHHERDLGQAHHERDLGQAHHERDLGELIMDGFAGGDSQRPTPNLRNNT